MDLAVEYNGTWNIIEVKLLRQGKSFEAVMTEGIRQTLRYRDTFSPLIRPKDTTFINSYLVIFDRRREKSPWIERIKWLKEGDVTVVGC
jgi:hypothetical protein